VGHRPAVIASIADHGRGEGADRRGSPAKEGVVTRERAGMADGWGRDVSGGRGRAAMGREREGECGRAREREGRSGPEAAQLGGSFSFSLFFLFPISYFYFLLLFLLSLFLLNK
jgi:hypothetical protein